MIPIPPTNNLLPPAPAEVEFVEAMFADTTLSDFYLSSDGENWRYAGKGKITIGDCGPIWNTQCSSPYDHTISSPPIEGLSGLRG